MTMRSRSALAAFLLMVPMPAAADPGIDFEALKGTWRGEGVLRRNPTSELQRGVCRVAVEDGESAGSLVFAGRCANATKSARFTTTLSKPDKTGVIKAVSRSRIYPEEVALTGKWTGTGTRLRSTGPIVIKGEAYTVDLTFDHGISETRFSMVQALKNVDTGVSANVLEMTFRKK